MAKLALILSDIRSTYNVGSLMRTADGFGVKHIYFAGYTPYPTFVGDKRMPHLAKKINWAIHKTALGAENFIPFSVHRDTKAAIAEAKKQGYTVAALEQSPKSIDINTYTSPPKLALILGNELKGVSRQTLSSCDVILEIPMLGKKESLNVSVSGIIAMYALTVGLKK